MRSTSFRISVVLGLAAWLILPWGALAATETGQATHIPWTGYWWSLKDGYLFKGWDGTPGPTQRYDQHAGTNATAWEEAHHYNPGGQGWEGHCHAWAAAAIMEQEPAHGADAGGVDFRVGDLKGLISECHYSDQSSFHGNRTNAGSDGDLTPDQLWTVLRDYIGDRKVPVVMDLDNGPQVWNYPVYRYQVDYSGSGNVQGQITIWAADDNVSEAPEGPNMVGTIDLVKTYPFQCQMSGNDIVAGTGQWTGGEWPDFAWFPTTQVPGNPEVDVAKVRQIAQLPDPGPGGGPPPPDGGQPPDTPGTTPPDGSNPPPPDGTGPPPPPPPPPPGGVDPGTGGKPWQQYIQQFPVHVQQTLLQLVNRPSDFAINVWPDKGDGATYHYGENLRLFFNTDRDCYVTLIDIDSAGKQTVLFPNPAHPDNAVQAGRVYAFPGPRAAFTYDIVPPPGIEAIKAIATLQPLQARGVRLGLGGKQRQMQQIQAKPTEVLQAPLFKPQLGKGGWASDVCIFFVEPRKGKLGKIRPQPEQRPPKRQIKPPVELKPPVQGKPHFGKPWQTQGKSPVPPPPPGKKPTFRKIK